MFDLLEVVATQNAMRLVNLSKPDQGARGHQSGGRESIAVVVVDHPQGGTVEDTTMMMPNLGDGRTAQGLKVPCQVLLGGSKSRRYRHAW